MTVMQRMQRLLSRLLLLLPASILRLLSGGTIVRDGDPLDAQCQFLLRMQRLQGIEKLGVGSVESQRKIMDDAGVILAPGAQKEMQTRNLTISGGNEPVPARLYRPAAIATNDKAPAIIFFHGGGFVIGSLDSHDGVCRALAERAACAVISVDYRMGPEHMWPAAVNDAVAAFRDMASRTEELGIDPARIAVSGDSAGGNLSAIVCQQTRDDTVTAAFQLLFYPVTDMTQDTESRSLFAEGFLLEQESMDWFMERYLPQGTDMSDPRISPACGSLADLPPALVLTAGFDPLRDEGEAYADALHRAGIQARSSRYPGLIHGFANFAGGVREADKALTEGAKAVKAALR